MPSTAPDTSAAVAAMLSPISVLVALKLAVASSRKTPPPAVVAMFDAMVAMADVVPFFWSMGIRGSRRGAAGGIVAPFKAKDGWFVMQAVREHHLALFANAVGHPEWLSDERFAERAGWGVHLEDVVRPAVEAWASTRTKLEVCAELCGHGIAAGPCLSAEDIIADPHVERHEMIRKIPRPDDDEPLMIVGNPIKLSETPERPDERWPTLGQHTEEILRLDLGLAKSEIDSLCEAGVIRSGPTP